MSSAALTGRLLLSWGGGEGVEGVHSCCIWARVAARASLSLGAQPQHCHLAQLQGSHSCSEHRGDPLTPYNLLLSSSSAPIIECCLHLGKLRRALSPVPRRGSQGRGGLSNLHSADSHCGTATWGGKGSQMNKVCPQEQS